jgi:hypothetical protein
MSSKRHYDVQLAELDHLAGCRKHILLDVTATTRPSLTI